MKNSLLSLAGVLSAALVFTGVVSAATAGQIEGGDIYRVQNVSTNSAFTDPATGTCGNTFQFKVRIHNPGPDTLTGVKVSATLPTATATSHSSKVTISATNANPSTTTDTAGIKLDKAAKLSYVAGSTELLDANGSKLSTLGDSILSGGVNIGTVGVSTQQKRFVQFKVKTTCPTKPPAENCPVPGKEDLPKDSEDCKESPVNPPVTPEAPKAPVTPEVPVELPQTGPAETAASIVGLGVLIASIGYYINSRRVLG